MTEINRIYVNSNLTVENGYSNTLCFIDGKAVTKTRYTLESNELNINQDAQDYISIFYNTNSSRTYCYEKMLNEYGTIVFGEDKLGNELTGLRENNILVFVDGKLLGASEYKILDTKNLSLMLVRNNMLLHDIVIYVSNEQLPYGVLTDPMNINGPEPGEPNEENKIGYSRDTTLIFRNGELLPPTLINNINGYTSITFTPNARDKFEYYKINKDTISLNFEATRGVTTYGPIDDYQQKIPNLYDSSIAFDDLAKIVVDDLRPGFLIREKNMSGVLMVTDTNYETNKIKTVTLSPFSTTFYTKDDYYLEVPEAKSINDYLSDYDKKFVLLPEVLRIFQRVLLDEIHDEIERIKNIRNVSRVNSDHIYKLLSLLGMKLDIKHLNLKQLQEALDELTEFYRVAGTKNSLNYFNIIQDNTKLINIKQLFTFHKTGNKKGEGDKVYSYSYEIYENAGTVFSGTGYKAGEKYRILNENGQDSGIILSVSSVGPNGELVDGGFSASLHEGKTPYPIIPFNITTNSSGAVLDCESYPYTYNYSGVVKSESTGFAPNEILVPVDDDKYGGIRIVVDTVDELNRIKTYHLETTHGTTSYNSANDIPLRSYNETSPLQLVVHAKTKSYTEIYRTYEPGEGSYTTDENALYRITISGAGGSGGASDTSFDDSLNKNNCSDGYCGEKIIKTIACSKGQKIDFYIGQGGLSSTAQAGVTCKSGEGGLGPQIEQTIDNIKYSNGNGKIGENDTRNIDGKFRMTYYCYCINGHHYHVAHSRVGYYHHSSVGWYGHYSYRYTPIAGNEKRDSYAAAGGGGGGSSFSVGNSTWVAKGGNGGNATWVNNEHMGQSKTKYGGAGGYGGSNTTNSGLELFCWADEVTKSSKVYLLKGQTPAVGEYVYDSRGGQLKKIVSVSDDGQSFFLDSGGTTLREYIKWEKGNINVGGRGGQRVISNGVYTSEQGEDGYIIIEKVTQTYNTDTELLNNHDIYLNTGDIMRTSDGKFKLHITNMGPDHKIESYEITPISGTKDPVYTIENGELTYTKTYNLVDPHKEATLDFTQEIDLYKYSLKIRNSNGLYNTDQILHDQYHTFTITTENVVDGVIQSYENGGFDYMPKQGTEDINFTNMPLITQQGTGAKILIRSTTEGVTTQNIEREYVDFYLPEEQGAVWHKDYRIPTLDYGSVNEGTPSSPQPWRPGQPDIEYGSVTDGTPNSPDPQSPGVADIDYGLVSEKIKGQWVEWMEWDRPADLYPTNHVEVEVNILSVEDYDQAINRFYKQFYSLASTVLYIHRLVTVYNFGNNTVANITEDETDTSGSMILMGFLTAQPFDESIYTITSDPARQNCYRQEI